VTGSQAVKGSGTRGAYGGTHARQVFKADGLPHAGPVRHLFPGPSPTVYAGQRLNHRESGGTADAPDLGSGARKGMGVRLPPLAPLSDARIDIAGVEPTQLVVCGPQLTLGLSTDGVLASTAVRIDIDEHHFQT
jgi:hypothetical protein